MSLFNLVVLVWALRVLRRLRVQEKPPGPRACRDTVTVLGLTVLLGTTWALAFFSFGVFLLPQLFLFTIFNSFYGRTRGRRGRKPRGSCTAGSCFLLKGCRASQGLKSSPDKLVWSYVHPQEGVPPCNWHKGSLWASGGWISNPSALPLWPPIGRDSKNSSWASGRPNPAQPRRCLDSEGGPMLLPLTSLLLRRFLPLPVVLLPEVPRGGGGGGRDGGIQLLPGDAVSWAVWTSWPGTCGLSDCLQPEAPASARQGGRLAAGHQRPLSPPRGAFPPLQLPRPRG